MALLAIAFGIPVIRFMERTCWVRVVLLLQGVDDLGILDDFFRLVPGILGLMRLTEAVKPFTGSLKLGEAMVDLLCFTV